MTPTQELNRKQTDDACAILASLIGKFAAAPVLDGDIHVAAEIEITKADLQTLNLVLETLANQRPGSRTIGESDVIDGNNWEQ